MSCRGRTLFPGGAFTDAHTYKCMAQQSLFAYIRFRNIEVSSLSVSAASCFWPRSPRFGGSRHSDLLFIIVIVKANLRANGTLLIQVESMSYIISQPALVLTFCLSLFS